MRCPLTISAGRGGGGGVGGLGALGRGVPLMRVVGSFGSKMRGRCERVDWMVGCYVGNGGDNWIMGSHIHHHRRGQTLLHLLGPYRNHRF